MSAPTTDAPSPVDDCPELLSDIFSGPDSDTEEDSSYEDIEGPEQPRWFDEETDAKLELMLEAVEDTGDNLQLRMDSLERKYVMAMQTPYIQQLQFSGLQAEDLFEPITRNAELMLDVDAVAANEPLRSEWLDEDGSEILETLRMIMRSHLEGRMHTFDRMTLWASIYTSVCMHLYH